jgi:histone H3/H4
MALPTAAMEKLLKDSGASRVSEESKLELAKILKKETQDHSKKASALAKHAGRKTIKKEDMHLCFEN